MHIANYLDSRNIDIWDELQKNFTIELKHDPKEYSWRVTIEESKVTIITPFREVDIPSFTHELLHAYVEYLGVPSPHTFLHNIYGENSFKVLTKNGLFAQIQNFLSHIRMFPFFVQMGFQPDSFLSSKATISGRSLLMLRLKFLLKFDLMKATVDYLGYSFSFLCANDLCEKGKAQKEKLKKLNPELFGLSDSFCQNWLQAEFDSLLPEFIHFDQKLNELLIARNYCR